MLYIAFRYNVQISCKGKLATNVPQLLRQLLLSKKKNVPQMKCRDVSFGEEEHYSDAP